VRSEYVDDLVSPITAKPMQVESVESEEHGRIKEGILVDASGKHRVPVRNFIPRFVTGITYADSFGEQWNRYRSVQIDRENKLNLSAQRFYGSTGWRREELKGLRILEAVSGAGRFTLVMLDAGASVYSFDLSSAVDSCWSTAGPHENLCLMQADIYKIPCKKGFFDRVFCYGVLQHTPDPFRAFMSLIPFLRPGGKISIDCYIKAPLFTRWTSKYLWRWWTTRIRRQHLFKIVEWYVPYWLPIDTRLSGVPRLGRRLVGIVPCWNYTGMLPLPPAEIVQWAILDTFDALSPQYDLPQTLDEVSRWFKEAGLAEVRVEKGSNGIVGNGVEPLASR